MSKFIKFDENGNLVTRYIEGVHAAELIATATSVSDELFKRTKDETDGEWKLVDDEVVKLPFAEPTVLELINAQKQLINADFETAMQQVTTGYPSNEISSWSKQESEARAYLADAEATTPLIDALAQSRLISKAELVERIIAKANLFAGVSGNLIGKRQGLEDQLDALDENATSEDIAAIVWSEA